MGGRSEGGRGTASKSDGIASVSLDVKNAVPSVWWKDRQVLIVWVYPLWVVEAMEPNKLGSNPSSKKLCNLSDLLPLHL